MEGPPATKRPRRIHGQERAGKRKLAQDTAASLPEKRSCRGANSEAERLLDAGGAIGDDKVLRVLRLWQFSENTTRANVMPRDASFVLSDTLGLVSTRTGVVTASRLTKRYPAVFQLFSTWASQAFPLAPRFSFTSVNVNYNYAARIHRDSNNSGPSLTKSFGEFHGGALRYWGDDDLSLSLEELGQFAPSVLEAGSLCLFDGRRAHSVEPFRGERYSLVFFCTSAFARAREEVLALVSSLGAHIPTGASLQRAVRCLAPAKGYDTLGKQQRGIREMCGKQTMPTYISWSTPRLIDIDSRCLDQCLSFVISPALMVSLCAVSKTISAAAHRPSSWCGTIVDASGRRPTGKVAMTHFKCWSGAKAVVGGSWERGSLSFLVDGTWVAWAFVHLHQHPTIVQNFPTIVINNFLNQRRFPSLRSVKRLTLCLRLQLNVNWWHVGNCHIRFIKSV